MAGHGTLHEEQVLLGVDAHDLDVELTSDAESLFARADAVVLVTEWQEYLELDWAALSGKMRTPLIIDGRSFLDRKAMETAGFRYVSLP